MSRIGIIGGTFDPPHVGHLLIAEEVRVALNLDEIWFIPTNEPPHKEKAMTAGEDRLKMVQKAIESNPNFKVNDIEMKRTGKSYTFDTMNMLLSQHSDTEFYFIIGADMVEYLPYWSRIDELMNMLTFVGVKRQGFKLDSPYPIIEINIPMIDISSSMIKERLIANHSVTYLIPESVEAFINEEHLYEHK